MTPKWVWEFLVPYIPHGEYISEVFHGDGESTAILRSFGFVVKSHKHKDFYKLTRNDCGTLIVTNPPFSQRRFVLQKLKELNIPFILILSTDSLHSAKMFHFKEDLQIIIPPKQLAYRKRGDHETTLLRKFDHCFLFC